MMHIKKAISASELIGFISEFALQASFYIPLEERRCRSGRAAA